jgi:hypothetical protein
MFIHTLLGPWGFWQVIAMWSNVHVLSPVLVAQKSSPLLGAWITWIPHSQWLTFGKGPSTGTCNFGARRNGNVQQLSTIHQSEIIQSYQDFLCKAPLLMSSWVVIFVRMSCPMMSFLWINELPIYSDMGAVLLLDTIGFTHINCWVEYRPSKAKGLPNQRLHGHGPLT